jgi:hypothetical protein
MASRTHSPDALPKRHGWLSRGSEGLRYRLGVASRAVAAIGGGYAVAAAYAAAIALFLPTSRGEAALTGTMTAFLVYVGAVVWVFSVRSATRAWTGLLAAALPAGLMLLWHYFLRGGTT